jgi:hypothetical protein
MSQSNSDKEEEEEVMQSVGIKTKHSPVFESNRKQN